MASGGPASAGDHLQVSRVVSMDDPVMAARAATHVPRRFSTVKLKVGDPEDWRRDVERVAVVQPRSAPTSGSRST